MIVAESHPDEPRMAMPTALLIGVILIALAAAAAISLLFATGEKYRAAIWGIGIVGAVAMGSLIVLSPWKVRPISTWMLFWLGTTVLRLLVTPLAAYLLYSLVSPELNAYGLAVGVSYVLVLCAEVAVLTRHLSQRPEKATVSRAQAGPHADCNEPFAASSKR